MVICSTEKTGQFTDLEFYKRVNGQDITAAAGKKMIGALYAIEETRSPKPKEQKTKTVSGSEPKPENSTIWRN
jgi:hypothetical protein